MGIRITLFVEEHVCDAVVGLWKAKPPQVLDTPTSMAEEVGVAKLAEVGPETVAPV